MKPFVRRATRLRYSAPGGQLGGEIIDALTFELDQLPDEVTGCAFPLGFPLSPLRRFSITPDADDPAMRNALRRQGSMANTSRIDESALTKGQRRKLHALRKSVGEGIGEQAFAAWLSTQPAGAKADADTNARMIVDTLWPLIEEGTLAIPRGGYLIGRGRGRIIVERARS